MTNKSAALLAIALVMCGMMMVVNGQSVCNSLSSGVLFDQSSSDGASLEVTLLSPGLNTFADGTRYGGQVLSASALTLFFPSQSLQNTGQLNLRSAFVDLVNKKNYVGTFSWSSTQGFTNVTFSSATSAPCVVSLTQVICFPANSTSFTTISYKFVQTLQ